MLLATKGEYIMGYIGIVFRYSLLKTCKSAARHGLTKWNGFWKGAYLALSRVLCHHAV